MSKRPSPAMVVAVVALSFGVVGSAVAAGPVAKLNRAKVKTITNKQIDKRAPGLTVGKAASADSATSVVANGVNTAALQDNAVANAEIATDAVGKPQIAASAVGASELANLATRTNSQVIANGDSDFVSASCNAGEQVISGGSRWVGIGGVANPGVYYVHGFVNGNGYGVRGTNLSGAPETLEAEALCLAP